MPERIPKIFYIALALVGISFISVYAFKPGAASEFFSSVFLYHPIAAISPVTASDPVGSGEPDVKIRYARPGGDDANDGLSWKTAKETIRAAIESLPSGGGTVYFADNTYAQHDKTKGLWLMGSYDPNYNNPPAGWLKLGSKGIALIGVGGETVGIGFAYDRPAKMLGGNPGLWIAGLGGFGLTIDNMMILGVPQPVRLGIDSNGSRDKEGFGAVGVKIRHSQFYAQGANAGPAVDIGGMSFWLWLENDSFSTESKMSLDSPQHAAIYADGGTQGHVGLLTIRDVIFSNGGLRYVTKNDVWGFTIENAVEEGDFTHAVPPAVQIVGGGPYGQAVISGVGVADAPGTEASIKIDPSIPPDAVLVYNSSDVLGPATIMNMYPASAGDKKTNPSGQNQIGFWQGRVWAVQDSSRRAFGPTDVRFVNLADQDPANWYPNGAKKTLGITAPDGTTGAAECSNGGYLQPYDHIRKYSVGDWIIFGVWARAESSNGYSNIQSGPNFSSALNQVKFQNGIWYVVARPIQKGDGEWQWLYAASKVTSTSGESSAILALTCPSDSPPVDYYMPILLHIPAGTVSDSEAAEIARHLQSWSSDPDATPGTVSLNEFQKFLAWQAKFKGDVNIDGTLQVGKGGIKFSDGTVLTSASQIVGKTINQTPTTAEQGTSASQQTSTTPTPAPTPAPVAAQQTPASVTVPSLSGIIAHYTFDEGTGTVVKDSSGNDLNGAVEGTPTWVSGIAGSALKFDGSDYVSVPDNSLLRLTGNMTISAWVYRDKATSNDAWVRIVGKGGNNNRNYDLAYYGYTGEVLFQIYGNYGFEQAGTSWGTVANKLTIDPGKWYLVTGVRQGNTVYLYLNGTLVSSNTFVLTPLTSSDPMTIGYANYSSKHIGKIDEVQVYNRALSQSEIQTIYTVARSSGAYQAGIDSLYSSLEFSVSSVINFVDSFLHLFW